MTLYAVTRGAFPFAFFIQNVGDMASIEAQVAARVARMKRNRVELTPTGFTLSSKQRRQTAESATRQLRDVPRPVKELRKRQFAWKPWMQEEDLKLSATLSLRAGLTNTA